MAEGAAWDIASLAHAGRAIAASASDPNELAEVAFLELARLIPIDHFHIGLFEGDQYRTLILIRDGDHLQNQAYTLDPENENIISWIRRTGQSLIAHDFANQRDELPSQPPYLIDDPLRSGLYLPLSVSRTTIGVVALQSRTVNAYSSEHLHLLTILGESITAGLNHLIRGREAEDLSLHLVLIQQISRLLISLDPLTDRLQQVVGLIRELLGYQLVQIFEIQRDQFQLHCSTQVRQTPEAEIAIPDIIARTAVDGDLVNPNRLVDTVTVDKTKMYEYAFPLKVVEHSLGALHIQSLKELDLEGDEGAILEMIAKQLGFAMLEARNYDERQEEAWMTTVLLEVAKHAAQPGDTIVALQAVLQLSTLLAGTEWALLLIPDETGGTLRPAVHAGFRRQQTLALDSIHLGYDEFGIQLPPGEFDLPLQVSLPKPLQHVLGHTEALCLGLSDGRNLLGLLLMQDNPLPGIRPALLAGIGHQVSLRLENARLIEEAALRRSLERELAMARNIQSSFLPDGVPSVPGWELASAWEVAREVGGDFYDFIPLPPNERGERWGIVIADVADKGIPAAIYMALCRTMLRSVAQTQSLPGRTLEIVNQQLITDTRADLFVSIFYAIWEPSSASITFANAGHLPPFLFRTGERAEVLREHGMVLGVMPDVRFENHSIHLEPGDLLVLYTDGVSEAQNSDQELFGFQRIESLILSQKDKSAPAIASAIVERVVNFSGSRDFYDDLTAVTLRRTS